MTVPFNNTCNEHTIIDVVIKYKYFTNVNKKCHPIHLQHNYFYCIHSLRRFPTLPIPVMVLFTKTRTSPIGTQKQQRKFIRKGREPLSDCVFPLVIFPQLLFQLSMGEKVVKIVPRETQTAITH